MNFNTQASHQLAGHRASPLLHRLSPIILVVGLLLSSCTPARLQNTSQAGHQLSTSVKSKSFMCMWFAYGQRKFICSQDGLKKAQEECDKKATEERKEKTTCSCTDDANYIKDMC